MRLLPGRYRGEVSFDEAITIREGAFWFLEHAIREKCSGYVEYSHWGRTVIPRREWVAVLSEWQALKSRLQVVPFPFQLAVLRFVPIDDRKMFLRDFARNCRKLVVLIDQLSLWINTELEISEEISILGI